MDRQIVYPGQIPLETDLLNTNRNVLTAFGLLCQELFGTATVAAGLACVANSPAALNVVVNPGRIYALESVDATAYSTLPADTTDQIVKQGILKSSVTLSTPAPGTTGQSINYLIEATYQDADTNAVLLPYYNASNPQSAWAGQGNNGVPQNTTRQGQCIVQVKAGAPAATGSQTTPAPDTNYVGLWVVTVAYGQSTVTSSSISQYASAPFANTALLGAAPAFQVSPAMPTPTSGDSSTKGATTQFVAAAIAAALASYETASAIATQYAPMPSGTRVAFQQATVPTGWTADTTLQNDSILRFVQPSSYVGHGGATAFSTWNASVATGAHTLTSAEIPAHTHSATGSDSGHSHGIPNDLVIAGGQNPYINFSSGSGNGIAGGQSTLTGNANISVTVNANTGGGNGHTHPLTNNINYVDIVVGVKN